MTKKEIAFLFPGQGAQYIGMAKSFYDSFPVARQTFEEADEFLGRGLSKIVFEGPESTLVETRNSQAGIYVSSLAILRVMQEKYPPLEPTICAGLSLGEYSALAASKRISFTGGLELVDKRGHYMSQACEKHPGSMAVIVGLEAEEVEKMVRDLLLPNDLWAANFNCPLQVVISGTIAGVEAGMAAAKAMGAKMVLPLRVHGAFHSGLMQAAEERLSPHVYASVLKDSPIDFVMNVPGAIVKDLKEIQQNLVRQVTQSVRWEKGIKAVEERGIDAYLEIGCGKVLANFNKRIGTKAPTLNIEHPEQLALIEKILD